MHETEMHETAQRLAAVALDLFEAKGYDAVTTADIAAAAGVSQRTFFRHFPNKHDALFTDSAASMASFLQILFEQPLDQPLGTALVAAIGEHAERWPLDDRDIDRARIATATPSLADVMLGQEAAFEVDIARWIAHREGTDSSDFDVRVQAAALVAARRVVVQEWIGLAGDADVTTLAARAIHAVTPVDDTVR